MDGATRWPHLFRPLALGPLELPNRIVMPGMDPSLADADGFVTDTMVRHYADRAAGGAGLLITGNIACDPVGRVSPWMPLLSDDRFVPGIARVAAAVHAAGSLLFVQVSHAGRQTLAEFTGGEVVSASDLPCPVMRSRPRPLADAETEQVADRFAAAARRAQQAGADGVEFHMAHGYLVCQFLSPYSNHRDDRWGRDAAGRGRFAVEIVRRARALVGPDFPLQCRLSADERVEGGITPPLAIDYARQLVGAGATSLSISACNYESYRYNMPSYYLPRATYAPLARAVRQALGGAVPVIAVGRIADGDCAEGVLAAGDADLVAMGRALIADPDLPRHLADGRPEAVRPCVACNRCAEAITRGPLRCLVNPEAGHLGDPAERPAEPLDVLVVGGGPAGVTAAIEAARRGHRVRLVEAGDQLGGKAWASGEPPEKEAFAAYARWLVGEAARAGIAVELNRALRPADLAAEPADRILVAVGAEPNPPPPIAGLDTHAVVLHPEEALADATPRSHVLIIGGGPEGCEVADAFAHRPERPRVSLVELRRKVGLGLATSVRALLEERLVAAGVALCTRRSVTAITPSGIALGGRPGRADETLPPADLVVIAVGVHPRTAWTEAGSDPRVQVIGDAARPATILEAVAHGWRAGRQV